MQFTVNLSRTKVLSILLALSMLLGSAGWIEYSLATTANSPWTLNAPPVSSFDVYVGKYANGTAYYETGDWQTWANGADTTILNTALALGGHIVVNGNFTITSTLLPKNYTYIDFGISNITLSPQSNCSMIGSGSTGVAYSQTTITGGFWNMQSTVQNGGTAAFDFGGENNRLIIENIYTIDVYGSGVVMNGIRNELRNIWIYANTFPVGPWENNFGFKLAISDSVIDTLWTNTYGVNFQLSYGSSNFINNIYAGGSSDVGSAQVIILLSNNNFFSGVRVDNSLTTGITFDQSNGNSIDGLAITSPSASVLAVNMSNSKFNNANNLWVGQKSDYPTSYNFTAPITESGTSSYNIYNGIFAKNCTSYTNSLGTGSINSSYIHP
jgi:hypothetical protein